MRKTFCTICFVIWLGMGLASCGGSATPDAVPISPTESPVPVTDTPEPTATPVPNTPTSPPPTSPPPTPTNLEFQSDAWGPNDAIPQKYSCDGENISPPLSWGEPPEGTQSFLLIMDDPDAKAVAGQVWDHWLLFNIPAEYRSLPEGIPAEDELADGSRHGQSSWGMLEYGGPCPPSGRNHGYLFRFYALDIILDLEPGATKNEIFDAIQGHVLGKAKETWEYPGK
jgi:Raf kinase inhibitor-like YbhB/YbcL family protein